MKQISSILTSQYTKSLVRKNDGIYYADSSATVSYPDDGNKNCFEIEENSFWFRHRNNCIIEMIKNFRPTKKNDPIFDVGGGNGFVAKGLLDAGLKVVLIEPGLQGVRNAKKRGVNSIICATTHTANFEPSTVPAIGLFDVIEHIEDDSAFLNHLWDLLVPGGMLYLTVPAHQLLWSIEDVVGGHYRRYTLSNLMKKIRDSGFCVSYSSYIFSYLPIFIFLLRTIPHKLNLIKSITGSSIKNDHSPPVGLGSKILNLLHRWELKQISNRRKIKFGGSCMLAVQKTRLDF